MRKAVLFTLVMGLSVLLYNNCSVGSPNTGGSSTSLVSSTARPIALNGTEAYIMPITVGSSSANIPLVTVKVCQPNTTNCVTVPDVLLDTGSYGLRVFASAVTGANLSQVIDNAGHHLAECVTYGDGSSDWGAVAWATVQMGGETATNIPIQIINSSFGGTPSDCTDLDTSPSAEGWNGILGVGLFAQDCGSQCAETQDNRWYFDCTPGASNCDGASVAVALPYQVTNPVAALPVDNQGVIMQMTTLPAAGASMAGGYLIMGIGSQAHNTPSPGTVFLAADQNANFQTSFNGSNYTSALIDSGSVGLYFPTTSALPTCTASDDSGWFCPATTQSLSAVQMDALGTTGVQINFQILNAGIAFNSGNAAFNDIGAPGSDMFDWGLPFFYGRTIYVGIEGRSSPLGTGPYWAF